MENKINVEDLVKNQEINAGKWAAAFMQIFGSDLRRIDEGLMISWFANAIMVTHDKISNVKDAKIEQLQSAYDELKKQLSVDFQYQMIEQLKAEKDNLEQLNSEYKGLHQESKRMRSEISALKEEIKSWMKKVSEQEHTIVDWENYVAREKNENHKLKSKLNIVVDALELYSRSENGVFGNAAREALKQIGYSK